MSDTRTAILGGAAASLNLSGHMVIRTVERLEAPVGEREKFLRSFTASQILSTVVAVTLMIGAVVLSLGGNTAAGVVLAAAVFAYPTVCAVLLMRLPVRQKFPSSRGALRPPA